MQSHRRFQDLKARGYDLRAVPAFRFDSVIEEPARRYGVRVDPALVDAVIEDAPQARTRCRCSPSGCSGCGGSTRPRGALVLDQLRRVGRLRGLIEDGAERALRGLSPEEEVALPSAPPPKSRLDLAASTFVPALAQVNDQGATIRRDRALDEFQRRAAAIAHGSTNGGWWCARANRGRSRSRTRRFFANGSGWQGWLEPERARLEALRSLQVDALTWDRNTARCRVSQSPGQAARRGELAEIERYRKRLMSLEFDYLAGCRAAELRERERRIQGALGALALGLIAGLLGWLNQGFLAEEWNWYSTMRPYMMANFRPHVLGAEEERKRIAGQTVEGRTFRECAKDCPEMIVVPAGEFEMGSSEGKDGKPNNEGPQHHVVITRPFAVAKNDVTFADWDACLAVGGCPNVADSNMGRGDKPVINVTFYDAKQYARWLSLMTGEDYRLLSEAEWEYAARGGTKTAYYWGDEIGEGNANCNGCGDRVGGAGTTKIGAFPANKYGLHDMAGNVYQWVEDCFNEAYRKSDADFAPMDGSPWTTGDCSRRVGRGGSWKFGPQTLRSASRNGGAPGLRSDDLGFRVARELRTN